MSSITTPAAVMSNSDSDLEDDMPASPDKSVGSNGNGNGNRSGKVQLYEAIWDLDGPSLDKWIKTVPALHGESTKRIHTILNDK